jgi:hypothetical protein
MVASVWRRGRLTKPFRVLAVYVWVGILFDIVALVLMKSKISTAYSNNAYTVFQFGMLSWVFYFINAQATMRQMVLSVSGLVLVFTLYNWFFFQGMHVRNSYSYASTALALLFFSLVTLRNMAQNPSLEAIQYNPAFLLSTGVLVYFGGNFFLFLFDHMADATVKLQFPFYFLHHPLRIVLNSLYFAAILCLPTRSSTY